MSGIEEKIAGTGVGIEGLHMEDLELAEDFMEVAARFAGMPGTVLLASGGELDCARFHILGVKPWLALSGRADTVDLKIDGVQWTFREDPFICLDSLLKIFRIDGKNIPGPLGAGLLGYLAYDLKDVIEKLPRTSLDDLGLPHILFYAPSALVVRDNAEGRCRLFIPGRKRAGKGLSKESGVENTLAWFKDVLKGKPPASRDFSVDAAGFESNFSKPDYIEAVEKIIEYIKAGHVYQVNMSQRFRTGFSGDGFTLFRKLFEKNPAPFFAYINAGDHQVVSTSPERFLLLEGDQVETRPIKGTRPRGKTPEEDRKWRESLLASPKDDAELSMIVDLLRNDIGKVCRAGSVKVTEHKRLEAYQNVYHLVSVVKGTLDEDKNAVDLVRACFPGGSITGCPKIRSMEIIDELEPHRRHLYTGSVGYIGFHGVMDLSIAIRTAIIRENDIYFSVGGGIVYDSNPADEYEETLHKGRTLMNVLSAGREHVESNGAAGSPMVWINGIVKPSRRAAVPVEDEGFLYGFGFFETIRAVDGVPRFLQEHLKRFHDTWNALFPDTPPDLTWEDVIGRVIEANGLENRVAAVKMLATRGVGDFPAGNRTLLVSARPYMHRLERKNADGLRLLTYPEPRQSPLADHKTLNYLYYLRAGRWAAQIGGDEALVLNPDGSVSETNTANILMVKDRTVVAPRSPHVLPGVFQGAALKFLVDKGFECENRKVFPGELSQADHVMIANSLMGAVTVLGIDSDEIRQKRKLLVKEINDSLL